MKKRLTIIGGGPGGYTAAFDAAKKGCSVTLVERAEFGGVCLNSGCIPTKALKASAQAMAMVCRAEEFGISGVGCPEVDMTQVVKRKDRIRAVLGGGLEKTCHALGITRIQGRASIVGPHEVTAETAEGLQSISGDALILATGSQVLELPGLPFDRQFIHSSESILHCTSIPKHLLIVGGGVIGCEMACIWRAFGAHVTIVEGQNRLLPLSAVDEDISTLVHREMKKQRVDILLRTTLRHVSVENSAVRGIAAPYGESAGGGEKVLQADAVLVTVGRAPATEGLNLEAAGVATDARGWILADTYMQTSVPGIWAIGDALGPQRHMLAHVAAAEGLCAVESILGGHREMTYGAVPSAIFTSPEVGCVGLSEAQAREQGYDIRVAVFQMRTLGKAQAVGELPGICKVVEDVNTGAILGVHLAGAMATDLLAEATLALSQGIKVKELAMVLHAHPTMAEGIYEAAQLLS